MWYTLILAVEKSCRLLLLLLYIISLLYFYNNYPYFYFQNTFVRHMLFGFNSAKGVVTRVVFTWSLRFGVGVGRQKALRVKSAPLHTVVDRQKRAGPFRFLLPLCP